MNTRREWLVAATAVLGLTTTARATPVNGPRLYDDIEKAIKEAAEKTVGRSLSIGIIENGLLAAERHYGSTHIDKPILPNSRTIYPIASMTKVLTGLMFLQLVDRGVVHLTDRVTKYVPEFSGIPNPYPWAPDITLMQLATMTSGIDLDDQSSASLTEEPDKDLPGTWEEGAAGAIKQYRFKFEPGTRRSYSNSGYSVLGLALSRAIGRPYLEYMDSDILSPLGMNDTTFLIGDDPSKRDAYWNNTAEHSPPLKRRPMLPAGGAFSTMSDMVKLMRFQMGLGPEIVLSTKALEDSFRLVVPSDGNLAYGDAIGFAAVRNPDSDLVSIGHGGNTLNFSGSYQFDRPSKSGIVVFSTHWSDDFKPVVRVSLKRMHPDSHGGTGLEPLEHH